MPNALYTGDLAGLLIARILKLPIESTYQSALPAFTLFITKDEGMEHIVRRYCTWFYNQMGSVYATSAKIAKKMAQEGIQSEKIKMIESWDEGINPDPPKEDGLFKSLFQLPLNWKLFDKPSSAKAAT